MISSEENGGERPPRSRSVLCDTLVASDPRLPFGGIKSSGYGRELLVGMRGFLNIKTVVVS